MPKNRFGEVPRASVVEEAGVPVDLADEADSPEWRSAPVLAGGLEYRAFVGEAFPQVVQQQVAVRPEGLVG